MKNAFLPFSLLLALTACGKKEAEQKTAPPPTPVAVVEARLTDAVYYDEYPATVVALNTVELRTQVSGFVTGISFEEGAVVKKGQVLYEVDRRQYEGAYQQALAGLRSAQATAANSQTNLARYQRLAQQDAIARQVLDNAQTTTTTARSQVAAAQAAVTIARTNLSFAVVRAPFAGRIGISQVRLGSQVVAGNTLLNTISSENPIGVDIVVPQAAIPRFEALAKAGTNDSTVRLQLTGERMYKPNGRIRTLDRGVDAQTGTLTVRAEFANPERALKDGMSAVLRVLNVQSGRRVVVPYKAIVEQMGERFVYVVGDSSKVEQRKVETGPRLRDAIVLLDGLKEGEKVVTEGVQKLRDGGKIQTGPVGK